MTRSTPAPTGTPTSARGMLDHDAFVEVVRSAGAPVIAETPGGPERHKADFDWLRSRL